MYDKGWDRDCHLDKIVRLDKVDVNGNFTHELYKHLRTKSILNNLNGTARAIPWNFAKFLLNKKGQVLSYLDPRMELDTMRPVIDQLIEDPELELVNVL